MAQLSVPRAPKEYATHYEMLLGVDYQADQTEVDRRRSPDMVNMISDFGGNPIKRDGYRRVGINYASLIMVNGVMYGIYASSSLFGIYALTLDGYEFTVGTSYSRSWNVGTVNDAFAYQEKIYVIATKCLISFDTIDHTFKRVGIGTSMMSINTVGESAPALDSNIPLTVYNLKPDGTDGKAYYDKNLFSIYQQHQYKGDGTSTQYKIPTYKKIGTWVKAEVKNSSTGDWEDWTSYVSLGTSASMTGRTLDGTSTLDSNVVDPTLTFASGHIPPAPTIAGEDNVRITFCPYSTDVLESGTGGAPDIHRGYYNETLVNLLKSGVATFQSSRMFIADTYKVYYSNVNDPFNVPDLAWFDVDSEVMCFTRSSSHLVIITKDNGRNTIFLADEQTRTVDSETGETETYFTVKASNAGIGAIAPKASATLSDEPMFLSSTGIFGILTNYQSEKYAVNRSSRINRRLCKEPDLDKAVAISYNDYLYVALNGRMYVLDGRHKEPDKAGNKPLEAYYFEGLPIVKDMYVIGGKMYFSDTESIYTWNDDLTALERYYDDAYMKTVTGVQYQLGDSNSVPPTGEWLDEEPEVPSGKHLWYKATFDDSSEEVTIVEMEVNDTKLAGDAVRAKWCSVFDDDKNPQKLKTFMKKGSMITIVPYYKSGCEITLVKDGDERQYLGSFDADIQTFDRIDFRRFSFNTNAVALDKFTKKKIKKYKRLQIIVENNKAEPFGITQITKTYTFGNYAKR